MLHKSPLNPILKAQPALAWANRKIYNAGAVQIGNTTHLVFRAIGDDNISRLGHATSQDGLHFEVDPKPLFEPVEEWEMKGCEDPRITKVGDQYVMAYNAYDGKTARIAVVTTPDFVTWSHRTIILPAWKTGRWAIPSQPAWNKAAAIFPTQINGQYHLFFGDDDIWQATSDDLQNWTAIDEPVLEPRAGHFDSAYIEMGPPPISTDRGWLILYHGIDGLDNKRVYRLGAALVDYDDPSKVLWRCDQPILEPTELFERIGQIDILDGHLGPLEHTDEKALAARFEKGDLPQAVFCCGAIEKDGQVTVYYSGGDTVLCVATGRVEEIL